VGRAAAVAPTGTGRDSGQQSHSRPHLNVGPAAAVRSLPALGITEGQQSARVRLPGALTIPAESTPSAAQAATSIPVAPQAVAAPVTPAAPAMVQAPATAAVASVPAPLLGSGTGVPAESPISWIVLATARRQFGASKTPVAPAVTVSTGQLALPTAAVRLVASNSPPVISSVPLSAPNSSTGAVTGTVRATDVNIGDTLSYKATTSIKGAVTITSTGVFVYTPTVLSRHAAAKVGATTAATTDTVTVTVTDSKGATATRAVTVSISPSNSVPVTRSTVGTPNASTGVVTGSVTATDANNDPLTYSGSTTTSKGTVTVNAGTGAFTYTPTATARHAAAKIGATSATTDTFTVTVTDGYGAAVPVAVTVAISPKNTAPVAGTTTVGTPDSSTGVVTGTVAATDAEKDTLTYSAPATTAKGAVTLNAATGAFTFTPSESSRAVPGTDSFTVTIVDGYGGSTPVTVSVPIAGTSQKAKMTFVFTYTTGSQYWTPEAKNALQSAANMVAAYIVVSKPVTVTFDVTAENSPSSATLASAGSDLTSTSAGFFNTVVQNKILTGVDSNGTAADGYVDVNFGTPWAYGDSVTNTQYDFTSTAMHELLHAFGFLSYIDAPGSSWNTRGTNWTTFDSFIVTNNKTKVIGTVTNKNRWNTAYNKNLTGGNSGLYFNGVNAIAANGGLLVPLYTPSPWESGSSVSHMDDSTFTGAKSQLMNALADTGKNIRAISAIELGILKDIGYTVIPAPATASTLLFVGFIFLRRRRR
jgi:VCBS repeat-containing protein